MNDQPRSRGIGRVGSTRSCPECERPLGVIDRFCRYCGERVREVEDGDQT